MATKKPTDYAGLRVELDEILASLGDETLDVEAMTEKYKRGMEIVQQLEKHLRTAENKIHKIKTQFDTPTT